MRIPASLAIAWSCVACSDPPAPPNLDSSGGSSSVDSTTTTVAADSSTTMAPEPVVVLDLQLELELREDVHVTFSMVGDELVAELEASRNFGIVGGSLGGPARIDELPEAEATLYTATFDGVAVADGPCGDQPISLALSLHQDHDANVIAGGLTGYCGAATFFGVPVIEPLRISGRMP